MVKGAQRIRIEAVAQVIYDRMIVDDEYSVDEARTYNAQAGWTFDRPGAGTNNWLRMEGVQLSDWELQQAYGLAASHLANPHTEMAWSDPRKTGRPRLYDEPLQQVMLELPADLKVAVDQEAARGETTRREWIETAIRQRLERDGVDGDEA